MIIGVDDKNDENELAEKLIRNLQVLEVICPHLHSTLVPDVRFFSPICSKVLEIRVFHSIII